MASNPTHPIRTARLRAQLSMEDLGRAVGVTKTSIFKFEHGRAQPRPQVAKSLAKTLGLRLEQVYAEARAA